MRLVKLASCVLVASAAALASVASAPRSADACGAFFSAKATKAEARPSLALERVLLVFDPVKKQEHFLREVVFRGSREKFGFVVPTPTRPTVAEVKKPPFDMLDQQYPFARAVEPDGASAGALEARLAGARAPKVVVLEVKYLGSFSAFVIQASDSKALLKWLSDNGFSSTIETDRWLSEYVRRNFYFVAFRYEPALDEKRDEGGLRAQSVRISFSTPVAFYPYREPEHAAPSERKLRAVQLWVASPRPLVPVALATDGGSPAWVRPFREGLRDPDEDTKWMTSVFGEEIGKLLPDGPLTVQTFQDQKTTRAGFGDAVFLPEGGLSGPDAAEAKAFVRSTLVSTARGE